MFLQKNYTDPCFLGGLPKKIIFFGFTLNRVYHFQGLTGFMKKQHYLIFAASLTLLTACGKNDADQQASSGQPKQEQVKLKPLSASLIPNGHWLFNPLHCSQSLPSQGVYDIKINGNAFEYIGITQQGEWHAVDAPEFSSKLLQYLENDSATCYQVEKDKLVFATFTAPGTQLIVGYNPGSGVIFTESDGLIVAGTQFNMDTLKEFTFVHVDDVEPIDPLLVEQPTQTENDEEGVIYENE